MSCEILVVSPGGAGATGGICRMVDYAARAWNAEGRLPRMRVIDSGGMDRKPMMALRFAAALLTVGSTCASGKAALVHIHVASGGSVVRKAMFVLVARAFGVPAILHMHGADFAEFHGGLGTFGRRAVDATFRACDLVLTLGRASEAYAMNEIGVARDRLGMLPNAVPAAAPKAVTRRPQGCQLMFLGSLCHRKGLDTLLAALATDAVRALDWRLVVAGDGDVASWQARAHAAGIGDRVEFAGWLPTLAARTALTQSDILVLPSRQEGMPIAILEAMAAGVPVIASDVGDIADIVDNGASGLLVPAGDAAALADAIEQLVVSAAARAWLGRQGRARHKAEFAIGIYNRRLARFYATTLQGGHGRSAPRLTPQHAPAHTPEQTQAGAPRETTQGVLAP